MRLGVDNLKNVQSNIQVKYFKNEMIILHTSKLKTLHLTSPNRRF